MKNCVCKNWIFAAIRYRIRKKKKPYVCEMIRMNKFTMYNLTWWIHSLGKPGKSDIHWLPRDVDVRQNLSFATRYWKRNSINYKLSRNIFLRHRPTPPAASAGGLSIAFLTEAANISTTRYDVRRLRTCTRSVTTYENLKVPFLNFLIPH